MASKRPNILLIMADQHNPHIMGCAGNRIVKTPNLDGLARDGVQFTNCYTPHPLCIPARLAFMTAKYPSRIESYDNGTILPTTTPTFAHALNRAGYEADLCGRMHFEGYDQLHGFEKRIFGDCFDALTPEIEGRGNNRTNGQTRFAVEAAGWGRMGFEWFDGKVVQKASAFIASRGEGDRPYCLVAGMMLPHNPLICSRELFEYYMERLPEPELPTSEDLRKLHPAIRKWRERRGVDGLTPEQHRRALAAYYGLVTELDGNVGKLVEAVKASDAADDTIIIYVSDHGDMASERGMWWKSCFYEGSARVPMIVSCPARFRVGRSVDAVMSLIDLGPTMLDIAGAEPMSDADGRSVLPLLKDGRAPAGWPNEVFSEYGGAHGDQPSCMVRSGDWKLMYYAEFDSFLLFNLREDPKEMRDRASDPACRDVAAGLLAKIHARWSAEDAIEGMKRQRQEREEIKRSGKRLTPAFDQEMPPPSANAFDFSQIPGWEKIRERIQKG